MNDTTQTMTDYKLVVTPEAQTTLARMAEQVGRLGAYYGLQSVEYTDTLASYAKAMDHVFGHPMSHDLRVMRDGDLSLFVNAGFIVFGVIWNGKKRQCTDADCGAQVGHDGQLWTWDKDRYPILDHEHTMNYPDDAPQPGTWSFHS
jgi:hypothetical protein